MKKENSNGNFKKKLMIILLIIIILLLLYFLILKFGNIRHYGTPTGNVDIFDIGCNCNCCQDNRKENETFNEDNDINKSKIESKTDGLIVYDDYKIWDNKELRIFANPAYEYESKIAPGSYNSYAFVIRNNNSFDVVVDINFVEDNPKDINMQFKLSNKGNYLIGNTDNYVSFNGSKKISGIKLAAKSQLAYILDWKWIDSDNDTEIGFDITSKYKLSILIGANGLDENN